MFKYERYTHEQIQANIEAGFKTVLLNIMPLDFCHCVATGCAIQWGCQKDDERRLIFKPLFRCLVIKSDKTNTIIVYEERPVILGGPRVAAFSYLGPRPADGSSGGPVMKQPELPEVPPQAGGFDFEPPKEWDGT